MHHRWLLLWSIADSSFLQLCDACLGVHHCVRDLVIDEQLILFDTSYLVITAAQVHRQDLCA
jgi:hypothetical protein